MKRIFIFLVVVVLAAPAVKAAETAPAVLERMDGRALRVFLQGLDKEVLTVRLDKAVADTQLKVADIRSLQFSPAKYDDKEIQEKFSQADYAGVISILAPATAPYWNYVSISNNLESSLCLLMDAYLNSGDYAHAKELSTRLMANGNPSVLLLAQAGRALSALGEKDLKTAEAILPKIQNPAAKLYVQACIERAGQHPEASIQTAIKLIAEYPNDMDWMPRTELLCARLYEDMGMTNAAGSTARQAQKLYAGTNIEKEAQALRSRIEPSAAKPE